MKNFLLIFMAVSIFTNTSVLAEFKDQGELRFETRRFKNDESAKSIDSGMGVYTRADLKYSSEKYRAAFRGYALIDSKDDERKYMTIEDMFFTYFFNEEESYTLSAGYKIFNWSATEAFHPADIINSRNLDSNIESLDKIGELTVEAYGETDIGNFSLYFFPYAEDPIFPMRRSRLGAGVDINRPIWVTSNNFKNKQNWHPQGAIRYTKTTDNGDLSLHVVDHFNRQNPIVGSSIIYSNIAGMNIPIGIDHTPYYFRELQLGGTYQCAIEGGWLIKTEGAYRDFYDNDVSIQTITGPKSPKDHGVFAFGIEYDMAHDSGRESNLILEGQNVFAGNKKTRSSLSIFQRDVMLGYRFAFNDSMGKEIFLSIIRDIERKNETLYNLYYTQRLNDNWKIKTGFRVYDAPVKEEIPVGLEAYNNDHYVFFNLSRFF